MSSGLKQRRARRNNRRQIECFGELGADSLGYIMCRDFFHAELTGDRSHDDAVDAARYDQVEIRKLGRDVEREAVPGDPIARVHSDRRDLLAASPHARVRGISLARNAVVGQGVDQCLLDASQVPMKVLTMALEIDDWIANQLARTVECHIAAPLDLEQLDATTLQKLRRSGEILFLRRPSERDDRRVLHQEQYILRNCAGNPVTRDAALQLERFRVRHPSERHRP
jgi:hypothetical protein